MLKYIQFYALNLGQTNGTLFFLREKVYAHSTTQFWERLYFFLRKLGKRKHTVFFFSQKKFTSTNSTYLEVVI